MEELLTVEVLSRLQFAICITFHYIYPPLSIGLSVALIGMEIRYIQTGSPVWERVTLFWLRVFALTFALGVATGIPLQFGLGTNWARYSRFVGDVFGSALAAEGFFAFLIEAGFLGLLLFGWKRISKGMHLLSTICVSVGAHFSAFWIIAANAWMQTPDGYELVEAADGTTVAVVTNWWKMVFNPSSVQHILHAIWSCWMAGGLLIVSVSAYYLWKQKFPRFALASIKCGAYITLFAAVLHLVSAHSLAQLVAQYQPVKLAAFEGIYETVESTPLTVAGWTNVETRETVGIQIPGMLSFLVHGDFQTPIPGLNEFPEDEWPRVGLTFQLYHLMVAMWGAIVVAAIASLVAVFRSEWRRPWLLKFLVISVLFPQIGNISGWYSTCIGRQPWLINGLMKTSEGFSPTITVGENLISLLLLSFMYLLFFVLFLFLLDRKIKHGPGEEVENLPYRDLFGEES